MTLKSPNEVPEEVRREMAEVIAWARGATVIKVLMGRLCESDCRWVENNIRDDEREKLG